jgi:S1-C subfamily serine protease
MNIPQPKGVLITDLAVNGAAVKAGLQRGDVIVKLNDRSVQAVQDLESVLKDTSASSKSLRLDLLRSAKPLAIVIELP